MASVGGCCACSLAAGQLRLLALLAVISCIVCSENGYRYPRDSPIFSRAAVESGQQFGRLASAQQPSLPTTSSEAGSGRPSATGATTTFSWPAAPSYPVQAQELPGQDADTRVQTAMLCPSGPTGLWCHRRLYQTLPYRLGGLSPGLLRWDGLPGGRTAWTRRRGWWCSWPWGTQTAMRERRWSISVGLQLLCN